MPWVFVGRITKGAEASRRKCDQHGKNTVPLWFVVGDVFGGFSPSNTIFKKVSKKSKFGFRGRDRREIMLLSKYWVSTDPTVAYYLFFFSRSSLCIQGWSWISDPSVPLPYCWDSRHVPQQLVCAVLGIKLRALGLLLYRQIFKVLSFTYLPSFLFFLSLLFLVLYFY